MGGKQMNIGVTGTRNPSETTKQLIKEWAQRLAEDDVVYHGCCVGVDGEVARAAHARGLRVVAVVPFIKSYLDWETYHLTESEDRIECPRGGRSVHSFSLHFRYRNEVLVEHVDQLTAFWNGNKRSGTWMTMNICRRAGKPLEVITI
jgi:predicted Rossmann fold nucleotide-binding protein DprA/Smf involved in DNA uptake